MQADPTAYLRVYLSDGAFTTLPITATTTAWQVCVTIAKKHLLKETQQPHQQPRTAQPHTAAAPYRELDDNIHIEDEAASAAAAQQTAAAPLPAAPSSSSCSAASSVSEYSWLHDYALFLHHSSSAGSGDDRRLAAEERLLSTLQQMAGGGQTDQYRLFFKQLAEVNDSDSDEQEREQEEEAEERQLDEAEALLQLQQRRFHAQCVGYLDRRMSVSSWKQRWFVLQQGRLICYKSHQSNPHTPLSSISVTDSIISPLSLYSSLSLSAPSPSQQPAVFEISTQQKIYYLRCHSQADMQRWIERLRSQTRVERENEEMTQLQAELDAAALSESEQDERRRREMTQGVEGVLYDDSGCDWLCKLAMEQRTVRELLCWMDLQVWFFVQRRARGAAAAQAAARHAGAAAGWTAGSAGDGSSQRRRRASSASVHSASPPGSLGSSASPAHHSIIRRPSMNASTQAYIAASASSSASSTPPSQHPTVLPRRRRSSSTSSGSSAAGAAHSATQPPSSFLPTLSASLIYSRYIEEGSEMEVQLPASVRQEMREAVLAADGEREAAVLAEVEVAVRETLGQLLYERWLREALRFALMEMPVKGGTMYAHHPWKFVMRVRRREEREEREREQEERSREEQEEAERERRRQLLLHERRRASIAAIKPRADDSDGEERKAAGDSRPPSALQSRRASLTRRVSSRGLILL